VAYDLGPQYQRQAPNPGSCTGGSLIACGVGDDTDGVIGAADIGAVPLPPIPTISTQSRGSTASILFVMMLFLLCSHNSAGQALGQGRFQE